MQLITKSCRVAIPIFHVRQQNIFGKYYNCPKVSLTSTSRKYLQTDCLLFLHYFYCQIDPVCRYLLLVEVKRTLDQLWWFPKTFVDVHEKWGLQLNMIVWWRQKFSINKVFVLIPLWVHNNSDSKVFNEQKTFDFSKAKAVNINS